MEMVVEVAISGEVVEVVVVSGEVVNEEVVVLEVVIGEVVLVVLVVLEVLVMLVLTSEEVVLIALVVVSSDVVAIVEVVEEKGSIVDVVLILPVELLDSARELKLEVGSTYVNDAVDEDVAGTGESVTVDMLVVVPVLGSTIVDEVVELELVLKGD